LLSIKLCSSCCILMILNYCLKRENSRSNTEYPLTTVFLKRHPLKNLAYLFICKLVFLTANLLLLHSIFLDYFYHYQVFVYTRGGKNLFVMNLSWIMFLCRFVAVSCNTIHWEVQTHVRENCFFFQFNSWQDTISMCDLTRENLH